MTQTISNVERLWRDLCATDSDLPACARKSAEHAQRIELCLGPAKAWAFAPPSVMCMTDEGITEHLLKPALAAALAFTRGQ